MIRRPKSVLNLPPKEREVLEVDVEDDGFWTFLDEQAKCLSKLQRRLMSLLDERQTDGTRAEVRSLNDTINRKTAYIRYQVGLAKLPAAIEYLRGCTGKTLVFAYHHDVIARLAEALNDRGVSWFTGASSLRSRDSRKKISRGTQLSVLYRKHRGGRSRHHAHSSPPRRVC